MRHRTIYRSSKTHSSRTLDGSRWSGGPLWLLGPRDEWQSDSKSVLAQTRATSSVETSEFRGNIFCRLTVSDSAADLDLEGFCTWKEAVNALGDRLFSEEEELEHALTPDCHSLSQAATREHF